MEVTVKQTIAPLQYEASTNVATIEVGARHNKEDLTFRPMELILTGLASCSAIDIENILRKQKLVFSDLTINATGKRADAIPAVFESIDLNIRIKGDIPENKLKRAIDLTKDKYCSVYLMLKGSVDITYSYQIINA